MLSSLKVKKYVLAVICLIALIMSLLPQSVTPVVASKEVAAKSKPCRGLDIVFLLSYAQSMKYNDALDLRSRAMRTALDIIGDNAVYLCPGFKHRIAVIAFGDEAEPVDDQNDYLDVTKPQVVSPELSKLGQWTTQKYNILQSVPDALVIGNYSNFNAAFIHASEILAGWKKDANDVMPRQQAVLVISDGNMCNNTFHCEFSRVFKSLNPIIDASSQYLPAEVSISHIGIYTSPDQMFPFWDRPEIFNYWKNVTNQHSGQLAVLQHNVQAGDRSGVKVFANQDIDSKVSAILNGLLGSDLGAASCNKAGNGIEPIWVEPYRNNFLVLYVYRYGVSEGNDLASVAVSIKVEQPDGTIETIETGKSDVTGEQTLAGRKFEYIQEGPNDRYIFFQPPPGKYSIKIDKADPCKDISILSGTRGVTAQLINPADGAVFTENDIAPNYDTANPQKFSIILNQMDQGGNLSPLQEMNDYPLQLRVKLSNRDGTPMQVEMPEYQLKLVDAKKAIYESVDPISLQYPGKYLWDMTVETKNFRTDVSAPIPVASLQGNLEIKPLVRTFNFTFISNYYDEMVFSDKEKDQKIEVQIQVNDQRDNLPLRDDLHIAETNRNPFKAVLERIDSTGKAVEINSQSMEYQSGNRYSATLSASEAGQFPTGKYRVRVELTSDYDKVFFVSGVSQPLQKEFVITQVKEQAFSWQVLSPTKDAVYTIRPTLNWFAKPDVDSLLRIQAKNLVDNQAIPAASMFKPGVTTSLFKANLRSGLSGKIYPIEYYPSTGGGEDAVTTFVSPWPKDAPLKGDYYLEAVSLNSENLSRVWVDPIFETELPVHFSFVEKFWASPWSLLSLILLVIIGIIAIVLIFLQFGPLYGCTLGFLPGSQAQQPIMGELAAWKVFRTRGLKYKKSEIHQKVSGAISITGILITSVSPTLEGARAAADIEVIYDDDSTMPVPCLNEGESSQISTEQEITFSRMPLGIVDRVKQFIPVLLITALAVGVWFAIFMYLFLKS